MSRLQKRLMLAILSIIFVFGPTQASAEQQLLKKFFPGHYVYANPEAFHGLAPIGSREDRGYRQIVSENANFVGYYVSYKWSELEPSFGVYDFSKIIEDLATAVSDGKVLALVIMERTWNADDEGFPGPSYMDPSSLEYNSAYAGMYFSPLNHPHRVKPNLWEPLFGDRIVALITAMGKAIDSHPALSMIGFEETANVDMNIQPGYTGEQYMTYLKRIHTASAEAFPNTIVHQTTNWRTGMSFAQADEFMTHLVETCKGAHGATDIMGYNNALDNQFGSYYGEYFNQTPVFAKAEIGTYTVGTPESQLDYAINRMGANFIAWSNKRGFTQEIYTTYDVIDMVNAENGRVNPNIPTNLIKPTPTAIPAPTGIEIILK